MPLSGFFQSIITIVRILLQNTYLPHLVSAGHQRYWWSSPLKPAEQGHFKAGGKHHYRSENGSWVLITGKMSQNNFKSIFFLLGAVHDPGKYRVETKVDWTNRGTPCGFTWPIWTSFNGHGGVLAANKTIIPVADFSDRFR